MDGISGGPVHPLPSGQAGGGLPNYEVSVAKLSVTETIQQVTNAALHRHGMHGLLARIKDGAVAI